MEGNYMVIILYGPKYGVLQLIFKMNYVCFALTPVEMSMKFGEF